MFVKVVKNNSGRPDTSFISIVESYCVKVFFIVVIAH